MRSPILAGLIALAVACSIALFPPPVPASVLALPSAAAQEVESVEVPTAEEVERLVAAVRELQARVAALEALHGDGGDPDPGPVDPPPVDPPGGSGRWPAVATIGISLDGDVARFPSPAADEWTVERGEARGDAWRFCVRRVTLGETLAILFLEQFEGVEATRVTWAVANAFPGTGAVLFDDLSVRIASQRTPLYEIRGSDVEGPDAIQVRGVLARRSWVGREAAKLQLYGHVETVDGYPEWTAGVCTQGLAGIRRTHPPGDLASGGREQLGPYTLGDPVVRGASSLNGSHGGWKVAPWHMGPDGWQRASRDGYRWAEVDMFAQLDRSPLAVFDPSTLHPLNQHTPYWPGRANVRIPGYDPDPDPACPYLPRLETFEAHSYSHLARCTQPTAMLARRDVFARWVLVEVYWHDITLWLDGRPSTSNLMKTAEQVIRELPAHQGWSNAGRGLAHSVRLYVFARPYFDAAARDDNDSERAALYRPDRLASGATWEDVIPQLLRHVARPNGILHSMDRDMDYDDVAPSARAREVDLMYQNLLDLQLDDIARACRRTMAPIEGISVAAAFDPRFETWDGGAYASPAYYPPYDWIRRDSLDTINLDHVWPSPNEQTLSMIPPEVLGVGR